MICHRRRPEGQLLGAVVCSDRQTCQAAASKRPGHNPVHLALCGSVPPHNCDELLRRLGSLVGWSGGLSALATYAVD